MSNFGFNFHLSNLFFDRGIEKSHNLAKRSWLTTIKTNEGIYSLVRLSSLLCNLPLLWEFTFASS